jgi:hypothetical protein
LLNGRRLPEPGDVEKENITLSKKGKKKKKKLKGWSFSEGFIPFCMYLSYPY